MCIRPNCKCLHSLQITEEVGRRNRNLREWDQATSWPSASAAAGTSGHLHSKHGVWLHRLASWERAVTFQACGNFDWRPLDSGSTAGYRSGKGSAEKRAVGSGDADCWVGFMFLFLTFEILVRKTGFKSCGCCKVSLHFAEGKWFFRSRYTGVFSECSTYGTPTPAACLQLYSPSLAANYYCLTRKQKYVKTSS